MRNQKRIEQLFEFMGEHNIELVSHGLAPNPNGFCYEAPDNTPKSVHKKVNSMLNALTKSEEQEIVKNTF